MLITLTDIANMRIRAGATLGTSAIIRDLITKDQTSDEYKRALEGARYYRGEHDILRHDFRRDTVLTIDADGAERIEHFRNPNRSNHLEVHPFFHNHVEQKVAYISGKEPSITVDGAQYTASGAANDLQEYQEALAATTGERFNDALADWVTVASWGGKAWLHEYIDHAGTLRQAVISRLEGIPVYDTAYDLDLVEFIRHYPIVVNEAGAERRKVRVEWWTAHGVSYYIGGEQGEFLPDPGVSPNPAPHFWDVTHATAADGVTVRETGRKPRTWGRVPFIELRNNKDATTDLQRYKSLIDANDLISSKGTNNLLDFNEFWAVVQGFGGDVASAIAKRLRINQAVSVGSQGGNIELKQLALDMQGRLDWLKALRDAIHEYGMAVDISPDKLGNAPSGVSLKFQYTLLDLKANRMIAKLKLALREHFCFVTEMINRHQNTAWDSGLVAVKINKTLVTNDMETVDMLIRSQGFVPEKTLLAAHPLVEDADQAYKDLMEERKQKVQAQREAFGSFGKPPGGDDE